MANYYQLKECLIHELDRLVKGHLHDEVGQDLKDLRKRMLEKMKQIELKELKLSFSLAYQRLIEEVGKGWLSYYMDAKGGETAVNRIYAIAEELKPGKKAKAVKIGSSGLFSSVIKESKEEEKEDPYERLKRVTSQNINNFLNDSSWNRVSKAALIVSRANIILRMLAIEKNSDPGERYKAYKNYWQAREYGFITSGLRFIEEKVLNEINMIEKEVLPTLKL